MHVVCISDTHCQTPTHGVPDGDLIIHAGDATYRGTPYEIQQFGEWFGSLPHKHKIFVAGNHDWGFQTNRDSSVGLLPTGCHYLEDSGIQIEGINFWGSPWQPIFCNWAFNLPRAALHEHWDLVPDGTDVLITHSPPYKHLDLTPDAEHIGDRAMADMVYRIKPKYHVFGHIHWDYGVQQFQDTTFINASICDERYKPRNKAIEFNLA